MPHDAETSHAHGQATVPALPTAATARDGDRGDDSHRSRRRKTRRLELATLDTVQQEVSMYLDSVANQRDGQMDTAAVDAALHEALRVLVTCWAHGGSPREAFEPVGTLSPIATNLLLTFGEHHITEGSSSYVVLRGGPEGMPRVGALLAVLRSLVLSRASAATVAARRQQQQHHRRHDLGSRSTDALASRQFSSPSSLSPPSPFYSYNLHHGGSAPSIASTQPYTSSLALAEENSQDSVFSGPPPPPPLPHPQQQPPLGGDAAGSHPKPVSRLLLLNCHSFGWLDSLGHDDYERSARTLQQVSAGIDALVQDPAFAAVGRPSIAAEGGRRAGKEAVTVVPAATTVLLSDAILMDGGVPSLALYASSTVLTAHHQYGRGLACLVPVLPPAPPTRQQSVTDCGRGYVVPPPAPNPGFPTTRMASNEESLGNSQLAAPPGGAGAAATLGNGPDADAEEENEEGEGWVDKSYQRALSAPPHPLLQSADGNSNDVATLKPISCGVRTLPGMVAQAVLLSPTGPLVLHVQFDPHTTTTTTTTTGSAAPPAASSGPSTAVGVEEAVMEGCRRLSCSSTLPTGHGTIGPTSPTSHHRSSGGGGGALDSSLAAAAHAREVVGWMLQLLRCPQAAILVEWHLDGGMNATTSPRSSGAPSLVGATAASSAVLRLLQSCAEALADEAHHRGLATHSGSGGGDEMTYEGQDLLELVYDTAARYARWPSPVMPQPDGRVRPVLFVRGLELSPEGERMISDGTIISSLQYRSV